MAICVKLLLLELREYKELAPVDRSVLDVRLDLELREVACDSVDLDDATELPVCGLEMLSSFNFSTLRLAVFLPVLLFPMLCRLNVLSGICSWVAKGVPRARSRSKNSSCCEGLWRPSGLSCID